MKPSLMTFHLFNLCVNKIKMLYNFLNRISIWECVKVKYGYHLEVDFIVDWNYSSWISDHSIILGHLWAKNLIPGSWLCLLLSTSHLFLYLKLALLVFFTSAKRTYGATQLKVRAFLSNVLGCLKTLASWFPWHIYFS